MTANAQEFQNIVDLIQSKDLGLIKLGIQLVETMECEDAFQKQYNRKITDFSNICETVLFPILNDTTGNLDILVTELFKNKLLFTTDDIFWILFRAPEYAKHLDTTGILPVDKKYLTGLHKIKFPK